MTTANPTNPVSPKPVVLVTAYKRGHWLAARLGEQGIPVIIYDCTEKLGSWSLDDWEGPFGYFEEALKSDYKEFFYEDDALVEQENGFCFWFEDGPWESRSLFSNLRENNLKWSEALKKNLYHSIGFNVDPVPAFREHNYFIRKPTRNGLTRQKKWLESKGVEFVSDHDILDIKLGFNKTILEVSHMNISKALEVSKLIWALDKNETEFLNSAWPARLGFEVSTDPQRMDSWSWVKFQVNSSQSSLYSDLIPQHSVLIKNREQPFYHDNLVVLKKTLSPDILDFWILIPTHQRFSRDYLKHFGDKSLEHLRNKLRTKNLDIISYPQEMQYDYRQLGPSRFYVDDSRSRTVKDKSHLSFLWPDRSGNFFWDQAIEHEKKSLHQVEAWWRNLNRKKDLST